MKRIVAVLLFICMCAGGIDALAFPYEWGTYLINYDMTEKLSSSAYWYVYSGREYLSRSEEAANKGRYSLKFDTEAASAASESNIILNFATSPVENSYEYDNNDIFCEFYVKGTEADIKKMRFSCYFTFENSEQINFNSFSTESCENGWFRISGAVSGSIANGFNTFYLSVLYLADGTEEGVIYIDDMTARVVPVSISVKDTKTYIGEAVSLSDINVEGYNYEGEMTHIEDKAQLEWSVSEGAACIDNGALYYEGNEEGAVAVKCVYAGREAEFNVDFKHRLDCEISCSENNAISVLVKNNYHTDMAVKALAVLYNGKSLYNVYVVSDRLVSGEEKVLKTEEIHIPHIITNPEISVYVFDSMGGCEKYNCVGYVKE